MIALFLFQGGIFYFLITIVTLRQRIVPGDILGRVHALARSLGNLGTPLGAVLGGTLAVVFPSRLPPPLCAAHRWQHLSFWRGERRESLNA